MSDIEQHLEDAQQEIERVTALQQADAALVCTTLGCQFLPRHLAARYAEIERLQSVIHGHVETTIQQSETIERLINKTEIDKITMDNFLGQMRKLQAELKQANAALERIAASDYDGTAQEFAVDALAALETEQEGYCYCKIGAGGPPCISREVCDSRGGTKQYTDKERES